MSYSTRILKKFSIGPSGVVSKTRFQPIDSDGNDVVLRRPGGGKRGVVQNFSKASRSRLLDQFCFLRPDPFVFLTVTFGVNYPSADVSKRILHAFFSRVTRVSPSTAILWRRELQERGADHYHMICFGDVSCDYARLWLEIIAKYDYFGSSALDCVAHGVDQVLISSDCAPQLAAYIGKYCAAVDPRPSAGRNWGWHNKKSAPIDCVDREVYYSNFLGVVSDAVGYDNAVELDFYNHFRRCYRNDGVADQVEKWALQCVPWRTHIKK